MFSSVIRIEIHVLRSFFYMSNYIISSHLYYTVQCLPPSINRCCVEQITCQRCNNSYLIISTFLIYITITIVFARGNQNTPNGYHHQIFTVISSHTFVTHCTLFKMDHVSNSGRSSRLATRYNYTTDLHLKMTLNSSEIAD